MIRSDHPAAPVRFAGLALAATLLVAACSGASSASPASSPASPAASASPETSTAYEVKVAQDPKVGPYLTGEDGKTLYVFKKDAAGKSNCSGQCATNWPPFTLDAGETVKAGAGVTGTLATITRDDGSSQVTYDGAPLYYFAGDKKAGDTTGQGLNGVWFVASPSGAATAAPPSASAAGTSAAIVDFGFGPATLTVKAGTTVTWTNTGSAPHTVTADDGSFDSGRLSGGATFSQTFAKAGTYAYHCSIHRSMTATVVVTG